MPFELKLILKYLSIYSIVSAIILFLPPFISTGWKMFFLVLIFLISMFHFIKNRNRAYWKAAFYFSLITSFFQVFPDWFLSQVLGTLVFPEDGFPKIGTVSLYMAGLWTIPLFLSIRLARIFSKKTLLANYSTHILTGIIALIIFWISEETMHLIPVWYAKSVKTIGHTAIYVLPAEFLLGVFFSLMFEISQFISLFKKIILAATVSIYYTGALAVSYLLIEKASF
jgi:hypothetical protein